METLFERNLLQELSYLDVGHDSDNYSVWRIDDFSDDILERFAGDVPFTLGHGNGFDTSNADFIGRIDHEKNIISMLAERDDVDEDRKKYVLSLLQMDYPGHKIIYWPRYGGEYSIYEHTL